MKNTLCILALLCSSTSAFAGEEVFNKLMKEVKAKSVFQQVENEERCPKFLTLKESSSLPEEAKEGDKSIYFSTRVEGVSENGNFTHEGNSLFYRPGLKEGKINKIYGGTEFFAGVVTTKATQQVKDGVLTSEYKATVASVVMVATSHFITKYDSNENTISYFFSGNGVEDVSCTFTKVK